MEALEKKLLEIQDLIKKMGMLPSPHTPKMPTVGVASAPVKPATPTIAPTNKKNPMKQAQQIQDPSTKKVAVKHAKAILKTDKNGQWSLDKNLATFISP